MNGKPDWPAAPAGAGKMSEPTHSNSHANASFSFPRFFGIVDGSGDPNRM
jgi:hypothetical protein